MTKTSVCVHVRIAKVWWYRWSRQPVDDCQYQCYGNSCAVNGHGRGQTASATYRQIVAEVFPVVVHRIQHRLLGRLHSLIARSRRAERSQLANDFAVSLAEVPKSSAVG